LIKLTGAKPTITRQDVRLMRTRVKNALQPAVNYAPPFLAALAMAVLTIILWQFAETQRRVSIEDQTQAITNSLVKTIQSAYESHAEAVSRMAARWAYSEGLTQEEWLFDAANYQRDIRGFKYFTFIDDTFTTRWLMSESGQMQPTASESPVYSTPGSLNFLQRLQKEGRSSGTLFYTSRSNEKVMLLQAPVFADGRFLGFVGGGIDVVKYVSDFHRGYADDLVICLMHDGDELFRSAPEQPDKPEIFKVTQTLQLGDSTFEVMTHSTEASIAAADSHFPLLILCVGFAWTLIVAWLIHQSAVLKRTSVIAKRQALALNQTSDAMFIHNSEHGIVDCNAAAVSLFGYSKAELIGMHTRDLAAENVDLGPMYAERDAGFAAKGTWTVNILCRLKNRDVRTFSITDTAFKNAEGQAMGLISIARDVTEQVQSNLRLEESENKFRSLFESSRDGITIREILPDGSFGALEANQAFLDIFGYKMEDLEHLKQTQYILLEEDQAKVSAARRQLIERGYSESYNIQCRRKDGRVTYGNFTMWRTYDELGKHIQTISIVRDLTDSKRTQESLEESQRIAELGSWEQDLVAKKGSWSAELYRIFEHDPSQRPHKYEALMEILHPNDRDRFARDRERAIAENGAMNDDYRIVMGDGRVKYIRYNFRVVLGADGTPVRRVGTVQDMTQMRDLENELRHTQKLHTVGQLTSGIAHDFNNILGVISSNTQYLQMTVSNNSDVDVTAGRILRAVNRGAKLTDQMLSFSRKQSLDPEKLDIQALFNELTETVSRSLGEAITIILDFQGTPWRVMADETQLTNAVLNLALNGRDAMDGAGRIKITTRNVTVGAAEECAGLELEPGAYVALSVTDSGSGMTQETQSQAFEPFFTTKEVGAGSGLGLSMVYGFAKQSGGGVHLKSELGVGTTVTLYLPGIEVSGTEVLVEESQDVCVTRPTSIRTILLVEDQLDLRMINEHVLRKLGHRVVQAEDAESALSAAAKTPHLDAAFIDVILPGEMNGIDLALKLRENQPTLKIMFTTGYTSPDVVKRLNKFKHDGLFRKPIEITVVSARMNDIFAAEDSTQGNAVA
jgi:PAS domain S-box-containing protein